LRYRGHAAARLARSSGCRAPSSSRAKGEDMQESRATHVPILEHHPPGEKVEEGAPP
jgi:hypothetical protein